MFVAWLRQLQAILQAELTGTWAFKCSLVICGWLRLDTMFSYAMLQPKVLEEFSCHRSAAGCTIQSGLETKEDSLLSIEGG